MPTKKAKTSHKSRFWTTQMKIDLFRAREVKRIGYKDLTKFFGHKDCALRTQLRRLKQTGWDRTKYYHYEEHNF